MIHKQRSGLPWKLCLAVSLLGNMDFHHIYGPNPHTTLLPPIQERFLVPDFMVFFCKEIFPLSVQKAKDLINPFPFQTLTHDAKPQWA